VVQYFFPWLGRRSGHSGSLGDAIPATCTHEVLAIGEKCFAGVKGHFLACPVDALGQAIGNINVSRVLQANDVGGLYLKA